MDLSILIISRNTQSLLSNCLKSVFQTLRGSDLSYEVIVIDNASTDGTGAMVQKQFPDVRYRKNLKNVGFGKANNQALHLCRGEYVLLLNSDTQVEPEAITRLYSFSKTHPKSFIGPKLVNLDGSAQSSCGPFFSLWVVFISLFFKGDVLGFTRWSPNHTKSVAWVSGACLMSRRSNFLDDLLFDEQIFMYMDEIDLLYRAQKKGYTVLFYPEARVMHVGSGSSSKDPAFPILNIYRGYQVFYAKHYSRWQQVLLWGMLQCKAYIGIIIGTMMGKKELKYTYEKALQLV